MERNSSNLHVFLSHVVQHNTVIMIIMLQGFIQDFQLGGKGIVAG